MNGRVIGALEARHAQPQLATREEIEVLGMLATHAATAMESARLHEVLEERSQTDALTIARPCPVRLPTSWWCQRLTNGADVVAAVQRFADRPIRLCMCCNSRARAST